MAFLISPQTQENIEVWENNYSYFSEFYCITISYSGFSWFLNSKAGRPFHRYFMAKVVISQGDFSNGYISYSRHIKYDIIIFFKKLPREASQLSKFPA